LVDVCAGHFLAVTAPHRLGLARSTFSTSFSITQAFEIAALFYGPFRNLAPQCLKPCPDIALCKKPACFLVDGLRGRDIVTLLQRPHWTGFAPYEIITVKMDADWVVLSACNTPAR
jgi:hypothetical protein